MAEQGEWWTLSTDGSAAAKACGGGVVILSLEGFRSYHAIKFQFKVSNNEAEYEALLSGLRIILNLKAEYVRIRCDSRLVVSQIKGEFNTKEKRMHLYKEAALELHKTLKGYELVQIPRAENTKADVLSKLSNDSPEHISKLAHVEDLGSPSIHVQLISVVTEETSGWIAELIRYKQDGILPNGETAARLIKHREPTYVIENGRLYKRSYNGTLLRCIDEAVAGQIMEEVHEGICATHQGPFSMARRIVLQGYFWPTMVKDCARRAKRCKVCQVDGIKWRTPIGRLWMGSRRDSSPTKEHGSTNSPTRAVDVAQDPLHSCEMRAAGGMEMKTELLYNIGEIGPGERQILQGSNNGSVDGGIRKGCELDLKLEICISLNLIFYLVNTKRLGLSHVLQFLGPSSTLRREK
ncbi:unnamed protein product [Cuscuta campestris]|uniref:Uncharacterized protein n=1 Tax=Cuscuta campestris TaxID=132261 RepID=A0A484MNF3_9ASTE|nr:unnamed protein product [Cuscuta campestris]